MGMMTKATITKRWIWGVIAFMPAGILIPSSALALAAHDRGVSDGYSRTMVGLLVLGGIFALGSLIVQLVAWGEAVLTTRLLADARWFKVLLWGGIAGILTMPFFGLGALVLANVMAAYLVGGPEGPAAVPRLTTLAKSFITKWGGRGFAAVGTGMALALVVANLTGNGRPLHGVLWPSLAIESAGFSLAVAGAIVVCAAWWGALFNAHRFADKTWFERLLWSGIAAAVTLPLFGFGLLILGAVLIAYRRSAPDGMAAQPPDMSTPSVPATAA